MRFEVLIAIRKSGFLLCINQFFRKCFLILSSKELPTLLSETVMGWGWGSETTLVSLKFISIFGENCHVRDKYVLYSSQHTQGLICVSNFVMTSLPVFSSDSLSCDYTPPLDATYPCQWSESRSVKSHSLRPHGLYSPWNSPGQNPRVGSLSLLQGNLPDPGIEPRSPSLQADSLPAEP